MNNKTLLELIRAKKRDILYDTLASHPEYIDTMTDYVAQETYHALEGRMEEQDWFYWEAFKRNPKAIHTITLIIGYKYKEEDF